jgi:pyruvate kinase
MKPAMDNGINPANDIPGYGGDESAPAWSDGELRACLLALRRSMLDLELREGARLEEVAPAYRGSARNLLHFIAFHRNDHPGLQAALRQRGLSSLEGCDPHLLHTVTAVLNRLDPGEGTGTNEALATELDAHRAEALLQSQSRRLFGEPRPDTDDPAAPAIMVTLPRTAAADPQLIQELVEAGMTIARINAAHDDPAIWSRFIELVRAASRDSGRSCRIAMDLAGPKLRTGPLPMQPGVVQGRPRRDRLGRLLRPFRLLALPEGVAPPPPCDIALITLPVRGHALERLSRGDRLRGRDASGRIRELCVLEPAAGGLLLAGRQRCRFTEGLVFRQEGGEAQIEVAPLPPAPGERLLMPGDRLRLTAAVSDEPDAIPCSLPAVFADVQVGERVLFDDGRIGAVAESVSAVAVELRITATRPRGSRLRSDKGINMPDTRLTTPALTEKDRSDLAFAVGRADLISYSFVRSEADIEELHAALADLGGEDMAVVLKIENRRAYETLPRLLLGAMRRPAAVGVMIARGDLAIECGWEALAEIQEEILRICAAAHVPCIWATQVLDEMARHGMPTRAEITDAAMGARAEALMLNKGPNITATVRTLQAIIARKHGHSRSHANGAEALAACVAFRRDSASHGD